MLARQRVRLARIRRGSAIEVDATRRAHLGDRGAPRLGQPAGEVGRVGAVLADARRLGARGARVERELLALELVAGLPHRGPVAGGRGGADRDERVGGGITRRRGGRGRRGGRWGGGRRRGGPGGGGRRRWPRRPPPGGRGGPG